MKRTATLALAFGLISTAQPVHAGPQATATEVFHLRTECGKLGDKIAEKYDPPAEYNIHSEGFNSHSSKYDELKNRCYVLVVHSSAVKNSDGMSITPDMMTLLDGQGGRFLALWSKNSGIIGDFSVSTSEAYDYIMRMMKDD